MQTITGREFTFSSSCKKSKQTRKETLQETLKICFIAYKVKLYIVFIKIRWTFSSYWEEKVLLQWGMGNAHIVLESQQLCKFFFLYRGNHLIYCFIKKYAAIQWCISFWKLSHKSNCLQIRELSASKSLEHCNKLYQAESKVIVFGKWQLSTLNKILYNLVQSPCLLAEHQSALKVPSA